MKKAKQMYFISTIIYSFLQIANMIILIILDLQNEYSPGDDVIYYLVSCLIWLPFPIAIIVCSLSKNKNVVFSIAILTVVFGVFNFFGSLIGLIGGYELWSAWLVLLNIFLFFASCLMITGGVWYITLFALEKSKKTNIMSNNERMTVAYKLMIVNSVFAGLLIIPLAWSIPMTLATKKLQYEFKESTGLGVCSILFLGLFGFISGILILVNRKENYNTNSSEESVIKQINVFAKTENT